MNSTALKSMDNDPAVEGAVSIAGDRIAPTWPLDQLIAVNPWWEMRNEPIDEVSARIALLGHADVHMQRDWFGGRFPGAITEKHLEIALQESDADQTLASVKQWLQGNDDTSHWMNFSDAVDSGRDLARHVSWHDEIIHQISQFCASFYSEWTPLPAQPDRCLYEAWLENVRGDRGIEIMMGERGLHAEFLALPEDEWALRAEAVETLDLPQESLADYFHALLLDINGWASWIAYRRWQARLENRSDDALGQLVSIRLAWELALWRHHSKQQPQAATALQGDWKAQFSQLPELYRAHRQQQAPAWIWQRAAEIAYQESIQQQLMQPVPESGSLAERPALQAALCIDVRSEVYRRALEAQSDDIQTIGFAGFFGLPIAYSPNGSNFQRPQLPGLLSPALTASEEIDETTEKSFANTFNRKARWGAVGKAAPAAFGYVESAGLGYAIKLLREAFLGEAPAHPINEAGCEHARFVLNNEEGALDTDALAELAAGILGALTLTDNFAPVVILAGHGSSTRNNPHAAGLDCGACGGQTGEINVRVLAQVLNDSAVRARLAESHSIAIPADTHFVAGLHDTTTDELHCLTDLPTAAGNIQNWLDAAGRAARSERAAKLGVASDESDSGIIKRSRDWSQVRPEWGLAGNACFIVAPRSRTRHLNFEGRSFLHDYQWQADRDNGYAVLELIMTAPMLVTHWINMQYNTSVVDNGRYGSGNKVLHNIVGGNLGVFEGNGGDLRIGLPLQSLHDGMQWMHDPLRLSVYIDAPAEAIADIASRHEVVQQLLDNDWLYLFRIDDEHSEIQRLYRGQWSNAA
ncbi:conserved hypothetical protein [Luminiphilus syltensis NOR5-1B]|uniref:Probable inorganic carbon transporter subunit DabA n=1 Tax=Luminiphilus syltensis NOR5-1B TaxID=565045 RepID=B8KVC5_9GAMM|nr:DUF2309 domain-containing protein [Luminiphilus syltensis]EED34593.1 conserved hypothetical protein [Luminiphilus syltensis NOR5-1B]